MSAAQPKPAEPSMEEILASIRRIISDDQAVKPVDATAPVDPLAARPLPVAPPVAAPAAAPATIIRPPVTDDDDDVMDLAPRPVAKPKAPEPHLIHEDPIPSDVVFEDRAPVFAVAPPPAPKPAVMSKQDEFDALMAATEFEPVPAPRPAPDVSSAALVDRLVSPTTDRVVSTAFSSLASTVLANNARTLESLVEEMMRPMIKSWLDDNLPTIVERLIKAEIERVARGGR